MKFQRIVIGIDDSVYAQNAAAYGFGLAELFNAEVALVHINEPMVTAPVGDPGMVGSLVPALTVDDPEIFSIQEQFASKLMENTVKKFGENVTITQFTEFGNTADGIINCIAKFNADLVVLGTHSRTGFDRFFMGSVAEDVVRHSPVPVLVVPLKNEVQ